MAQNAARLVKRRTGGISLLMIVNESLCTPRECAYGEVAEDASGESLGTGLRQPMLWWW